MTFYLGIAETDLGAVNSDCGRQENVIRVLMDE
jgi:hypothetical protein